MKFNGWEHIPTCLCVTYKVYTSLIVRSPFTGSLPQIMAKPKRNTEVKKSTIQRKGLKKARPTSAELRAASNRLKCLVNTVLVLQETEGQKKECDLIQKLKGLSLEEKQSKNI